MPKRITTIDFPLGALWRRLVANSMVVIVFVATAFGLMRWSAVVPQPSAPPEFSDTPGSGLIVRSEVVHLWLPETLADLARTETRAIEARTHQELKKALERRGLEKLWYAITVRGHQVNHERSDISFIRYPYRQPESLQELLDILAIVVGSPPREPSADYSAAKVSIIPAGMSRREWLDAMQPSSVLRRAAPDGLEPQR
jgi:hypothetical protein